MSFSSFGRLFQITTFGESHGPALGVVVDGVPPRFELDLEAIQAELDRRRPGQGPLTSARREADQVEILSGLLERTTTGAPLCMVIFNRDARPEAYEQLRDIFRPGHADVTYQRKYGIRDWRGGGRASGRETAARVAAGAVARQVLAAAGVSIGGHVVEIGGIKARRFKPSHLSQSLVGCADPDADRAMADAVAAARDTGDSVGGVVEVRAQGVQPGWGDPVFGKLDAGIAGALMSIGAVKGVEIGDGFALARSRGSRSNDAMTPDGFATNHAGGVLGGIATGAELVARLAVKPTPSIRVEQHTVDAAGEPAHVSVTGRHDACIAPRIVPVAEAMMAVVLVDAMLAQRAISP